MGADETSMKVPGSVQKWPSFPPCSLFHLHIGQQSGTVLLSLFTGRKRKLREVTLPPWGQ